VSRSTSVSLGPHFSSFIDNQVQGGRYGTASDVIRAGLRLLEEHETKVKSLQNALQAGLESDEPKPFDFETFKAGKRAALQAEYQSAKEPNDLSPVVTVPAKI
jgi:antitoxin ParD1/3/4